FVFCVSAATALSALPLHDALPIYVLARDAEGGRVCVGAVERGAGARPVRFLWRTGGGCVVVILPLAIFLVSAEHDLTHRPLVLVPVDVDLGRVAALDLGEVVADPQP